LEPSLHGQKLNSVNNKDTENEKYLGKDDKNHEKTQATVLIPNYGHIDSWGDHWNSHQQISQG
jgi:hypothetical protein